VFGRAREKALKVAREKHKLQFGYERFNTRSGYEAQRKKDLLAAKVDAEVRRRCQELAAKEAESIQRTGASREKEGFTKAITAGLLDEIWNDTLVKVSSRRGLKEKGRELVKIVPGLTPAECLGILAEAIAAKLLTHDWQDKAAWKKDFWHWLGIDTKKVKADVERDIKAKESNARLSKPTKEIERAKAKAKARHAAEANGKPARNGHAKE
jgi:hypothetical protein